TLFTFRSHPERYRRELRGAQNTKLPETSGLKRRLRRMAVMEPVGANLGRFPSKFLLMIIPGLIASGVVALVLYAVHISRAPLASGLLTDLTPQGDGLSTEERRGLTREMLKARREHPEEPAQVRPLPTSRPATTAGSVEEPAVEAKSRQRAAPLEAKALPERPPAAAPLPAAPPALAAT